MSDQHEFPGGEDLTPSTPTEGDFPADFFDDAPEPSPAAFGGGEGGASHEAEAKAGPVGEPLLEEEPVEVLSPKAAYTPPSEPAPGAPVFPIALGLLMIGLLVTAVFVSRMPKSEPPPAPAAPASAAAAPAETPAAESLAKELSGKLDGFVAQLKALEAKVEGLPKPPPPADLKPIEAKFDELSKSVSAVSGLPDKLAKLDGRVAALDDAVVSARKEVASLSDDVKKAATDAQAAADKAADKVAEKPKPAAGAEPDEPKPAADGPTVAAGADLFKSGKYKEADEVFKKVSAAGPKDARAYYYAALTHGLTTGDWQGDAIKSLAAKGADLEKSGATKPADVDAEFTALPANLKPWLDYFRKAAK
jgi:TolA-binding protein